MTTTRERVTAEGGRRSEQDAHASVPSTGQGPVPAGVGLDFDGLGNRALLSLLRSGRLQRKARLSEANDPAEFGADRTADSVVAADQTQRVSTEDEKLARTLGLGSSAHAPSVTAGAPGGVIAQAPGLHFGWRNLSYVQLERKSSGILPIVHDVLDSPGVALTGSLQSAMESSLGHDLSAVRIHEGSRASEAAAAVNSLAFTVGSHIVFGQGQFQPSPRSHLLVHELVHVVQQTGGGRVTSGSGRPLSISSPSDAAELEAEHVASSIVAEHLESNKPLRSIRHQDDARFSPTLSSGHVHQSHGTHRESSLGIESQALTNRSAIRNRPGSCHVTERRAALPINPQPASRLYRAMRRGCLAPSEVVNQLTASRFGAVAETLIELDYLSKMGGRVFADVFFDSSLGPMAYVAFLKSHHPSLNVALLAVQIGLSGGVLVPDVLDTRSATAGPEFYEIKPDSPDGRAAGRGKLAAIDAFMRFNSLPYVRGRSYSPTPSIPIPLAAASLGAVIGLPIVASCGLPIVTLAPRRAANGLLLYEVCIEADLDCYLKVMALQALIAAVIIAILSLGPILIPVPVPA